MKCEISRCIHKIFGFLLDIIWLHYFLVSFFHLEYFVRWDTSLFIDVVFYFSIFAVYDICIHIFFHIARLFLNVVHFLRLPGTFPSPSFVKLTDRWPWTIDRYKSIVCSQLATQRGRDSSSCAGSARGPLVSIRYIRQMNALCANERMNEYWVNIVMGHVRVFWPSLSTL